MMNKKSLSLLLQSCYCYAMLLHAFPSCYTVVDGFSPSASPLSIKHNAEYSQERQQLGKSRHHRTGEPLFAISAPPPTARRMPLWTADPQLEEQRRRRESFNRQKRLYRLSMSSSLSYSSDKDGTASSSLPVNQMAMSKSSKPSSPPLQPKEQQQQQQKNTQPSSSASVIGVVAPLKYIGPYPCLELKFPDATATGTNTNLNFLLDTGANVNSIDSKIVQDWNLPKVLSYYPKNNHEKDQSMSSNNQDGSLQSPALVGIAGLTGATNTTTTTTTSAAGPGDYYQVGNCCQLAGLPPNQEFCFLRNFTAASLTKASPVGNGVLGQMLFQSFPAGVEFDWSGTDGDPPTLIFYFGPRPSKTKSVDNLKGMTRVPLQRLPGQIYSLQIIVDNGVTTTQIPALLDTGAPMTIFNKAAAELAGIDTCLPLPQQEQQPYFPTSLGDEQLQVSGSDGGRIHLQRSVSPVSIGAKSSLSPSNPAGASPSSTTRSSHLEGEVSLGRGHVYVGDLPGLAMMMPAIHDNDNKHVSSPSSPSTDKPAAILGLDFLRQTYRMTIRVGRNNTAEEDEVWFEEWNRQQLHP